MSVKTGNQNPTNDVVETLMSSNSPYHKMARQRSKTKKQREKAAKDAARNTMTFDLPVELIESLKLLSDITEVSYSQFAGWLLGKGILEVVRGRWRPQDDRMLSRSPQYDYKMNIPDTPIKKISDQVILPPPEKPQSTPVLPPSENVNVDAYANVKANARVNAKR